MKRIPPVLIVFSVAAVLLAAGLLIFSRIPRESPDEDEWYVAVKGSFANGGRFYLGDLKGMGEVEFRMALLGTNEDGMEHSYRGIALSTLLEHCSVLNGSSKVTVRASDAYSASFSLSDARGHMYLAWEKDGKPLKSRSGGGPGPLRLLVSQEIAGDYNAQRCVKYVSEVIVE